MRAGEREPSFGVIERGAGPVHGGVTDRAIGTKSGRNVIGVGSGVVQRKVAGVALGGRTGEFAVDVTLIALQADMSAAKRECRLGVIERGARPIYRAVANGTIERKRARYVIWIGGAVVQRKMAGIAIRWSTGKLAADVALCALQGNVTAG